MGGPFLLLFLLKVSQEREGSLNLMETGQTVTASGPQGNASTTSQVSGRSCCFSECQFPLLNMDKRQSLPHGACARLNWDDV